MSLFFTAAVSAPRHQPSSCTRAWDGYRSTVEPEEEFYIHTYAHNAYINTFMHACIRTYMTYGMDINHIWHVDSGATSHMCSNKNLFKTINFKHKADVFMADGQKIPTTGIGDIFLQ